MIFISNAEGVVTLVGASQLNQGSNKVNEIIFVGPFPATNAVAITVELPNGQYLFPDVASPIADPSLALTPLEHFSGLLKDANGVELNAWSATLQAPITSYSGDLTISFIVVDNDGGRLATASTVMTVSRGAVNNLPALAPTQANWTVILEAIASAQTAEANAQTAASDAEVARNTAQTAEENAKIAKALAEDARDAAIDARDAAQTAEANASGSATAATNAKDDAIDAAALAEGYAVGKQNGVNVDANSPYFENNAKYYAEEAARIGRPLNTLMSPVAVPQSSSIWSIIGWTNSFRLEFFNRIPQIGETFHASILTSDLKCGYVTCEVTGDIVETANGPYVPFKVLEIEYVTAVPSIDPAKVPNGDPTNPATVYDVGTYAGIYSEYFGSDGKWRPRLLKSNAASYANLTEASVTKFVSNLKTTRIPITDSVGRLSVAAPQKGSNGETHYYNPEASTATNNTYNSAIPLWYADDRYIKNTDRSSIVQEAKSYTDTEIEKVKTELGGGKLYRHDIYLSSWLERGADLWFSFYNSDPTSYESHYVEDEETFEILDTIDLTPLNHALGRGYYAAYGYAGEGVVIGVEGGGSGDVDTVYITTYTFTEGYGDVTVSRPWGMQDCYDTVTEISL